jgi:hypothetical protein
LADNNNLAPAAWLLGQKLTSDADGTLAWLKANAGEFQKLLGQGDAAAHAKYISRLARAASDIPGGLAAAACLLNDCVPDGQRKAVAETEDAAVASAALAVTHDADGAGRMLDWLEAVRPSYTRMAAQNMNAALPAEVTSRAAELAKPVRPS